MLDLDQVGFQGSLVDFPTAVAVHWIETHHDGQRLAIAQHVAQDAFQFMEARFCWTDEDQYGVYCGLAVMIKHIASAEHAGWVNDLIALYVRC